MPAASKLQTDLLAIGRGTKRPRPKPAAKTICPFEWPLHANEHTVQYSTGRSQTRAACYALATVAAGHLIASANPQSHRDLEIQKPNGIPLSRDSPRVRRVLVVYSHLPERHAQWYWTAVSLPLNITTRVQYRHILLRELKAIQDTPIGGLHGVGSPMLWPLGG